MYSINAGYQPHPHATQPLPPTQGQQRQTDTAPFRGASHPASQPRARGRHPGQASLDRLPPTWSSAPAAIQGFDAGRANRAVSPRPPSRPMPSTPAAPAAPSAPAVPASPDSAPSSPLSIPFTEIDALLGALSPSMLTIAEDVARLRDPWEQPAWDMPEPEPDRGPQPTRAAPQRVVPRPVPELPADTDSPPGLDIDSQQAAAAQAASPGPMRRKPVRREARPQPYTEPPRPTSEGRVQKETPRSGVTRDVILRISRRVLAGESIIRVCAEPHGLALKTVRVFVEADGRLTAVGRALNAGHIMTPLDRQAGSLPPVGRQAVLHPEDHALAEKLIGATMGKMSRSLFCDLFGYDYDPVYFAYNGDGSLTEWGRKSRDAAPRGQAGAAAASTTGASAAPIVSDADCSAMEQRLFDVASDAGIAIGYWRGDTFQKLGRLMSPLAGNVDRAGGYWRIRPADAGEYRLIPDARSPEHIVNILRLHAEGHPGIDTLAATYVLRPSGIGQAVLVTPKAAGTPTTPA